MTIRNSGSKVNRREKNTHFETCLQYDTSYQGIDARRKNLRRALEAPEHYAALAEYREKIEHDFTIL